MKKKVALLIFFLCLVFCSFFGCATLTPPYTKTDTVSIVALNINGITFSQNVNNVKKGEDIILYFSIEEGLVLDACDYDGEYLIQENGAGMYALKLLNVRYDGRISISTNRLKGKVYYYLNGGLFLDEANTSNFFMVDAVLKNHLRLNTDIGDGITREGYTQLGWNTKADGTGEHIGLGSRVTIEEGETIALYAEWEAWSPNEYFTYVMNYETKEPGDIALTEYHGPQIIDRLSIPAWIDGKKVSSIRESFSQSLQVNTLIFPNTIFSAEIGAFRMSEIKEIYFFDNLREVNNGTFGKSIAKVHINAAVAPRYMGESDNSQFSEDMDRLILNANKKKMIFFGGCSMSYGLNSKIVEEEFDGEYFICNMAVIGGTNAWFQYLCMIPYMGEGDIFVHAPEEMSSYQLLYRIRAEQRMFTCVESNYDLLASIDCSRITAFFECFQEYNDIRLILPESSYEAYNASYNEYGDIIIERPNAPDDADFGLEPLYDMRYVNDEAMERLNYIYGLLADKGATVYFSFAPINRNALSESDIESQIWLQFENRIRDCLQSEFKVISTAEDFLFDGKYFYDTDYHMSEEGAILRTERLLQDIKKALEQNEGDEI